MTGLDPISSPLAYPGEAPTSTAVLVLDDALPELMPSAAPPGEWAALGQPGHSLDSLLAAAGAAPMSARTPVLAVGSNASAAQLRRKFSRARKQIAVPITAATVHGLAVGVSAHVSVPGYVPATPIPQDAAVVSNLFVTWLDETGLAVMDETEPNYHRVTLDAGCEVRLPGGGGVAPCLVYVSRHGYLLTGNGTPRQLTDQRSLIRGLLADVPGLAALAGADPMEWLTRTRDPSVREEIREMFRSAGLVRLPASADHEIAGSSQTRA
jgi:hypothetical protein